MKYFKLFIAFLAVLAGIGDLATDNVKISTEVMGPFTANSDPYNVNVTLFNSKIVLMPVRGNLKLEVKNRSMNQMMYFKSEEITLQNNQTTSKSIPLPMGYFFEGTCHFTLSFEAQLPYFTIVEFDIFESGSKHIEIGTLENGLYTDESVGFQIIENKVIYKNEHYDFRGFSSELICENYYRLELEQFYFVYESHASFIYEKAFLSFEDPFDVFPLLEEENELKIVPLKVFTLNDDKFQITFDKLYVEENYLWMSSTYKEGLAPSPYFYLPLNVQEELFGIELRLSILKAGGGRNDFHFSFDLYFGNNLFGACHSSDFCLVGGMS